MNSARTRPTAVLMSLGDMTALLLRTRPGALHGARGALFRCSRNEQERCRKEREAFLPAIPARRANSLQPRQSDSDIHVYFEMSCYTSVESAIRCHPIFSGRVDAIDDGESWETHQTLKTQLIDMARRRAVHQAG